MIYATGKVKELHYCRRKMNGASLTTWSIGLLGEVKMERPVDRTGQKFSHGKKETAHSRLSARYLRKEFSISKPIKRATVFICGLGLYELFINGQHIGNQVLTPAPTDYRKNGVI